MSGDVGSWKLAAGNAGQHPLILHAALNWG
jgi:hypothetical protein